jgi:hypothetical protein
VSTYVGGIIPFSMEGAKLKISESDKAWLIERYRMRFPEIDEEILWALGSKLPKGMARPPKWVKKCIWRLLFVNLAPRKLRDVQVRKLQVMLAGAFDGLKNTVLAALENPTEEERRLEEVKPEIRKLRLIARDGIKKILRKRDLPSVQAMRPADMTVEDWNLYYESSEAGSKIVTKAAEDEGGISENILWWMWIIWHRAEETKTRPALHRWISDDMRFVVCDFHIFEKVCRQIKYRSVSNKRRLRGEFLGT